MFGKPASAVPRQLDEFLTDQGGISQVFGVGRLGTRGFRRPVWHHRPIVAAIGELPEPFRESPDRFFEQHRIGPADVDETDDSPGSQLVRRDGAYNSYGLHRELLE